MSDLHVTITGFVAGDDLEIRRAVTDLTAPIETAWLTIKRHQGLPDQEALVQKRVTAGDVPGTGQIVAAGGADVDGDLRFDLSQADTAHLGARRYVYDIQIKLTAGQIYTIEKGVIQLDAEITKATS